MAVHHITVTLTGNVQAISTPTTGQPSINVVELHLQSELNNAVVAVGGPMITASDYGYQLISSATVAGELVLRQASHRINLASTYLLGTNGQKVHVLYVQ